LTSSSNDDDESPRMKKPKDLATDEDREWETLRRAVERKLDDD